MKQRIWKAFTHLVVGVVAAAAGLVLTASPAQAFGGETFGCRVSPGTVLTWRTICNNNKPASVYIAGFNLLNLSGDGYTFSWSWTGPVEYVHAGCTSTAAGCGLAVLNSDSVISVTVTYSQGGQTATKWSSAVIRMYCGTVLC
jgi:hypothetical protein